MSLVENIQRQDLDPIEIALSYQRLMDDVKLTQEQMSQRVGKKRSTIANYLRLLTLDPIIQTGLRDGFISINQISSSIGSQIKLNYRVEKILKKGDGYVIINGLRKIECNKVICTIPSYSLKKIIETEVKVKVNTSGKGFLSISFDSQEDLNRIVNKINNSV